MFLRTPNTLKTAAGFFNRIPTSGDLVRWKFGPQIGRIKIGGRARCICANAFVYCEPPAGRETSQEAARVRPCAREAEVSFTLG